MHFREDVSSLHDTFLNSIEQKRSWLTARIRGQSRNLKTWEKTWYDVRRQKSQKNDKISYQKINEQYFSYVRIFFDNVTRSVISLIFENHFSSSIFVVFFLSKITDSYRSAEIYLDWLIDWGWNVISSRGEIYYSWMFQIKYLVIRLWIDLWYFFELFRLIRFGTLLIITLRSVSILQ